MPILTEKAVERACFVKDGEVFVAEFGTRAIGIARVTAACSSGANKIGNTICRQRVVIPTDDSGSLSITVRQTAIANTAFGYPTTLRANCTSDAFLLGRRFLGQAKRSSRVGMNFPDKLLCFIKPRFQAPRTEAQHARNRSRCFPANLAFCHDSPSPISEILVVQAFSALSRRLRANIEFNGTILPLKLIDDTFVLTALELVPAEFFVRANFVGTA